METKKIGIIHNSYTTPGHAPKQGFLSRETSVVEILPEYEDALLGVEPGRKYVVLYEAHLADRSKLQTVPPWADRPYGVFASRSPHRPNPINICIATLLEKDGTVLKMQGLDAVDGSFLIDMKPFVQEIDAC